MGKRRGKIDAIFGSEFDVEPLVKGGDDYDYCVRALLDEMELKNLAYHTRRWHRENLHYVKRTLLELGMPLDYTMMLVLLDTGVRLIELEGMKTADVDFKNNKILVYGKGAKEREVIFQSTTKEYLRRYMLLRGQLDHDNLWITDVGVPMMRRNIEQRISIYGNMAGLANVRVSPHTFRHTCAKMYITRGGDFLSLQKLLGHSTLEMVRHYVNLWGSDLQKMHRKFSPVEGLFNDKM